MNRIFVSLMPLVLLLGLVACAVTETEEKPIDSVESNDQNEEDATSESESGDEEPDEDGETHELNKEIADNDDVKVILTNVEKIIDPGWDEEKIEVTFEVENKREDTIEVQAREVSIDDKMVDESMLIMSQEISGGKLADAVLTIQSFDKPLPEMEENMELILHIFDWEFEFENDIDVRIDF